MDDKVKDQTGVLEQEDTDQTLVKPQNHLQGRNNQQHWTGRSMSPERYTEKCIYGSTDTELKPNSIYLQDKTI